MKNALFDIKNLAEYKIDPCVEWKGRGGGDTAESH